MPEEPKTSPSGPLFNLSITDLFGTGKGAEKLAATVQAGTGRLADGVSRVAEAKWLNKADADNEAYRIQVVGAAETRVIQDRARAIAALAREGQHIQSMSVTAEGVTAELTGIPPEVREVQERALRRMTYENTLQQLNRDTVVAHAATELEDEQQISDEPVDPDWITRFFRAAQDVSNEEAQILWGKILAGEIKQPSSFSMRTLDVLRNLSKEEAATFSTLCSFLIELRSEGQSSVFLYKGGAPFTTVYLWQRVGYENIKSMLECGLLQSEEGSTYSIGFEVNKDALANFKVGSKILSVSGFNTNSGKLLLPIYNLTTAGKQLASLITPQTPLDYVADFAKPFQAFGLQAKHGEFVGWSEDDTILANEVVDLPDFRHSAGV